MQIIRLELKDLEDLVPLFDAYRQFYRKDSDQIGAEHFLRKRMERKEAIFIGAKSNERLCGFVTLYSLFSSVRMKPVFLLNDLFVDPVFRNQSIGKLLLSHAQDLAIEKKCAGILLETEKTNDAGNHLYPSVGFNLEAGSNFYFWTNQS